MCVLSNTCSYLFIEFNGKISKLSFRTICTTIPRLTKRFNEIPGPLSLPGIGTLHQYLPVIGPYKFDRLHLNGFTKLKKFGPIVREQIVPGVNLIWLFKPEDIETLFRKEGKYPHRRSHLALEKYRLDKPNVYNTGGLLPTNGPEWFKLRSVFQRGLSSPAAVLNFLPGSDRVIEDFLNRIDQLSFSNKSEETDYLPELSRLFLELTCLAALDLRLDSFSRRELKHYSRSSQLMKAALVTNSCILKTDNGPQLWRKFETPMYRKLRLSQEYMEECCLFVINMLVHLTPWNMIPTYQICVTLNENVTRVAIDLLSLKMTLFNDKDKNRPLTLLESYLSSPELDFKDIIGMVCDFLLAGIDTSTYSMSFVLYHLAKNHPVQSTLYQECRKLLPKPYDPVTKDVLNQAQYAKAVLKESMRLRPVSVGIGRVLDNEAEFSGFEVPPKTVVVTQNQISCRLEQYFPAAHEFKPERWIKNHPLYKASHPFLVLPFGHGPRSCIARRLAEQNMLTLILKLTRNFKITWEGFDIDSRSLLINKPDGPIALKFEKR